MSDVKERLSEKIECDKCSRYFMGNPFKIIRCKNCGCKL